MNDVFDDITIRAFNLFKEKIIKLPYFDSLHYVNNVKSLQIKMIEEEQCCSARYIAFSNTIVISHKKSNYKILLHELIHMASSNRTNINQMKYKMGYEMVTDECKRLTALNEGLTQLIVCNVTDGNDTMNDIYPIETRIAKMLVYIFGENEVYKSFFKAEPEIFIRNIMSRTGDNNIATLIVKMDELLETMKKPETTSFDQNCSLLLNDIQKVLIDMFIKMKINNNLDDNEFLELLIKTNTNNKQLGSVAACNDLNIEQYFIDKTKQK